MLYSYINYINLLPWLIIFQVLMFADCLLNPSIKGMAKGKWFVIMFLLQGLGAFVYFAFAPSLLFESILNMLVSLKQNATSIQTFIQHQQRKRQPSQPKIQPETFESYSNGYQSQIPLPSQDPSSPPYNSYETPHATYPTPINPLIQ